MRVRVAIVIALFLSFAPAAAAWQWPFEYDPTSADVLVEGRLVIAGPGLAWIHGAPYGCMRGTILVERVVLAEQGVEPGSTVEVTLARHIVGPHPSLPHDGLERGVWILDGPATSGAYTSLHSGSCVEASDLPSPLPGVRLLGGTLDRARGEIELQFRYENLTTAEVELPRVTVGSDGVPRGLGALRLHASQDELVLEPGGPTGGERVRVHPGRYVRSSVHFPIPAAARDGRSFWATTTSAGTRSFTGIYEPSSDAPECDGIAWPFVSFDDPCRIWLVPPLHPAWLLSLALLGMVPLVTRGRWWRWTPLSEGLAAAVVATPLALLPWSVLGATLRPELLLSGLAIEAGLLGVLWRLLASRPHARRGLPLAALTPLLVLLPTV
jgi:hypothetical protein